MSIGWRNFFTSENEERFYEMVAEIATENMEENDETILTIEQFFAIKLELNPDEENINRFYILLN